MDDKSKEKLFMKRLTEAQPVLFGFVAAMLRGMPEEVDDTAQNANLALIEHCAEYDPSRPFTPWMIAIARSKIADTLRKRKAKKTIFDCELLEKASRLLASQTEEIETPLLARLAFCRRKLNGKHRRILSLRYDDRKSFTEISRATGLSVPNVHNTLVYIRRKLAGCVRNVCSLGEMELAKIDGGDFENTYSNSELLHDDDKLQDYLWQTIVDVALSHRFAQMRKKRKSIAAPLATAACLAALLSYGAFVFTKPSPTPTELPTYERNTKQMQTQTGAALAIATAIASSATLSVSAERTEPVLSNGITLQSFDTTCAKEAASAEQALDTLVCVEHSSGKHNLVTEKVKGTIVILI